jgi:hypothetical protein
MEIISESNGMILPDCEIVKHAMLYGINESIRASRFPMAVDTEECAYFASDTTHKLATAEIGSGHDNFMNGILVQFDLTLPVKVWTELQRYHFIDFVSSQSTMHRIAKFDLDSAYCDYTDVRIIGIMKELVQNYNDDPTAEKYLRVLYSNPCGFKLTARMTTNYRQLKTIWKQRHNHRLPEWKIFCKWIECLPYGKEWLVSV